MGERSRVVRSGARPGETGPASLPALALRPVLAIAVLLASLLIALSDRYGYYRDELYFIAGGKHLAWGYPDQPAIARLMTALAPGSLVMAPAAVGAGGRDPGRPDRAAHPRAGRPASGPDAGWCGRRAGPGGDRTFHWLETATFNLLVWALLLWLLVRILRTGDQRLWLVAGLTAGAGLLNSDLVAFLIAAVVAAAGPRAPLRSGWFYAGGAIALALWVPYLAWQGRHGWPELTVAHSIAAGQSGTSAPW
jgi:hypothetical protein